MGWEFVQSLVVLYLNLLLEVIILKCLFLGWNCSTIFFTDSSELLFSEALSRLNVVIRDPNALLSDNVMAYDNAVSALGKICQYHRDSIDSSQVH